MVAILTSDDPPPPPGVAVDDAAVPVFRGRDGEMLPAVPIPPPPPLGGRVMAPGPSDGRLMSVTGLEIEILTL